MKLRTKHRDYDVILDSKYVRYPRPSIRVYVRAVDARITLETKRRPGVNIWNLDYLTTEFPVNPRRVVYYPIPF